MKTPAFLSPGDVIAIAAPSFGCTIEPYISRFKEAVRLLEKRGYKIKAGSCVFKSDGLGISSNPKDAAKELVDFYLDPKVNAIISAGGGELMCETMSYVDFEALKNSPPKMFMGYSDNTNFIFPLVTISKTMAVYGPCISGLGKPWEDAENDTISLIEGKKFTFKGYPKFQLPEDGTEAKEANPLSPYILTQKKKLNLFSGKEAKESLEFSGILIGGCLDVLNNLAGTSFDCVKKFNDDYKKVIWVLEACDLSPMDIRRSLWHLRECGWFKSASAFIIGRPLAAWNANMMGVNHYNAVTDIIGEMNLPVIMDADVGHIAPTLPLLMGAEAEVKADCKNWKISYKI